MKKQVNYFFRWHGGGYNSVMATSKKEALQKAIEMGKANRFRTVSLVPDADSIKRDADYKLSFEMDKAYALMFD